MQIKCQNRIYRLIWKITANYSSKEIIELEGDAKFQNDLITATVAVGDALIYTSFLLNSMILSTKSFIYTILDKRETLTFTSLTYLLESSVVAGKPTSEHLRTVLRSDLPADTRRLIWTCTARITVTEAFKKL